MGSITMGFGQIAIWPQFDFVLCYSTVLKRNLQEGLMRAKEPHVQSFVWLVLLNPRSGPTAWPKTARRTFAVPELNWGRITGKKEVECTYPLSKCLATAILLLLLTLFVVCCLFAARCLLLLVCLLLVFVFLFFVVVAVDQWHLFSTAFKGEDLSSGSGSY